MIQRAKINIQPNDCIVIIHYDVICELGYELRTVLDSFPDAKNSKISELEKLLHNHYLAVEGIEY